MDGDLLLIFTFIIVITTITGFIINGVVQKVLDYKREKRSLLSDGGPKAQGIVDRTEMIEDRLAVLERLATDRGQMLADEIEQLRVEAKPTERTQP